MNGSFFTVRENVGQMCKGKTGKAGLQENRRDIKSRKATKNSKRQEENKIYTKSKQEHERTADMLT